MLAQRRRSRYAVRLTGLDLLRRSRPGSAGAGTSGAALVLTALAGSTAAFADPSAEVQVPRERATVVVALDVSLSMAATDVAPDRFTAAKAAAQSFVDGLPARFNVGLVAFSGTAAVVVPATQEHLAVERAIGTAAARATAPPSAKPSQPPCRPSTPSLVAATRSPRTSSCCPTARTPPAAASTPRRPWPRRRTSPSRPSRTAPSRAPSPSTGGPCGVPVDAPALAQLAAGTDGSAYEAADGEQLTAVYADIGSSLGTTTERQPVGAPAAGLALLATVGAAAAAVAWAPRAL